MHRAEFWDAVGKINQQHTEVCIQHFREAAAILSVQIEREEEWLKQAPVQNGIHLDRTCIKQAIRQALRIACSNPPAELRSAEQPLVNSSTPTCTAEPNRPARQDNLASSRAAALHQVYGGSDEFDSFMKHLVEQPAADATAATAANMSAATDVPAVVKEIIAQQLDAEQAAERIGKLSDEDLKTALAAIPDPQEEVDRIMQQRRLQTLVQENNARSQYPTRFITSVDGHNQPGSTSSSTRSCTSNEPEPPAANIMMSLSPTKRDELMVEIYQAAKDLVNQIADTKNMTPEAVEALIFKQADKMLKAYIEQTKRPPHL